MKSILAHSGLILGIASIALIVIAGPGSRAGLYSFSIGIFMMMAGGLIGVVTVILSIIGLAAGNQNAAGAVAGLVCGGISAVMMTAMAVSARSVPAIHDITTDTLNPPEFVSILKLRKDAPNPASYDGKEVAEKQLAAYPDIKTLHFAEGTDEIFSRASAAAGTLGWKVIDENRVQGRIEAVDTTLMFGFKDDIVIRISPEGGGSRLDIRSLSRVGKSDIGTNAKRIRKFMKLMGSERYK